MGMQEKLRKSLQFEISEGNEPFAELPEAGTESEEIMRRLSYKVQNFPPHVFLLIEWHVSSPTIMSDSLPSKGLSLKDPRRSLAGFPWLVCK